MKRPAIITSPDLRAVWDALEELDRLMAQRTDGLEARLAALEDRTTEHSVKRGRPPKA